MTIRYVQTHQAPIPAGHYSQATIANGFIFIAGQLPIIPGSQQMPSGITAQIKQIFANVQAILREAKADWHHLVSVQIFISDSDHWGEINSIYKEYLGKHKPARTVIPCGPLRNGALIEINAVAVCDC